MWRVPLPASAPTAATIMITVPVVVDYMTVLRHVACGFSFSKVEVHWPPPGRAVVPAA